MAQYTKYPLGIDTSTELPKATDLVTAVNGESVNRLREAILAIENELGIQPSGTNSTVRARLDYLENTSADVTFEAVKTALAQADSSVSFNDFSLTDISLISNASTPIKLTGGGEFDLNEVTNNSSYIKIGAGVIYLRSIDDTGGTYGILSPNGILFSSDVGDVNLLGNGDFFIDMGNGRSVNIASTSINIASSIEIGQVGVGVINLFSDVLNWNNGGDSSMALAGTAGAGSVSFTLGTVENGYSILKLLPLLTTNNTPDTFPMVEISPQPTRQEIQIFAKDPNSLDIASWFLAINMELRLSTNTVFLGGNRLNVVPDESDASMSGLEVSITGATGAAGFFIEVTGLPSDDVSWQVMVVQVTP